MNIIDGQLFKEMLRTGNHLLQLNKTEIDALNVFPVPDGDTGTNMGLTMKAAVAELEMSDAGDVSILANQVAMGALMGARGNSGVILSQLIRGFSVKAHGKDSLNVKDLQECLQGGVDTAFKAVMKPIEGTILTVAREAAAAGKRYLDSHRDTQEINQLLQAVYEGGKVALEKTPEQLPALKQAGVVDAGGQGWLMMLQGFLLASQERGISSGDFGEIAKIEQPQTTANFVTEAADEVEFGYCTEFLIKGQSLEENKVRERLLNLGDCLLVVGAPEFLKVHIHTNNPGEVLDIGLKYGTLHQIKIDNMRDQHRESLPVESIPVAITTEKEGVASINESQGLAQEGSPVTREELKPLAVIAVAMGEGLGEIFTSLGVDKVIYGGQTMNPSTGDFLDSINQLSAREIIILPNNSNIILTAKQVTDLVDKTVSVVPTKSIPQGIGAMMAFNKELSAAENLDEMIEMASNVRTGEITYAVRNTQYEGQEIKTGDILGLLDDKITIVGTTPEEVLSEMLVNFSEEDQLVSIYYGEEVDEKQAANLQTALEEQLPGREIEIHPGGQPLYYYIFSIE